MRDRVVPLVAASSLALAAAIAVGPRTSCWRHRSLAWGAIVASTGLVAAGATLAIRTPDTLGTSQHESYSRQTGALLLGAALPLLTAGLKYVWQTRATKPNEYCPLNGE